MSEKINGTIDLSKIDKSRIVKRTYTTKDGTEMTAMDYKFEVVPLKQESFIKEGQGWKMFKTHFLAQAQTKEEREAKKDTVFIGDGIRFDFDDSPKEDTATPPDDKLDDTSIPF